MRKKDIRLKLDGYFAQGLGNPAIMEAWPECPLDSDKLSQARKRWKKRQARDASITVETTAILDDKNISDGKDTQAPGDDGRGRGPFDGAIAAASGNPTDELAKWRAKKQAQAVGMPSDNETAGDLPPGAAVAIFQHLLEAPGLSELKQYVWTDVVAATKVETRASLYNTYLRVILAEKNHLAEVDPFGAGAGGDEIEILTDEDRDERIAQILRVGMNNIGVS